MPAAYSHSFVRRRMLKLQVYLVFASNLVNARTTDARSNVAIKSLHALLIPQRVLVIQGAFAETALLHTLRKEQ